MNAGPLNKERITDGLNLRRIGGANGHRLVEVVPQATSTNDLAWARAQDPAFDGYVVFAEHQTAGRGRFGRRWESPRGAAVMCSVLLFEQDDRNSPLCSLAVAVACAEAIRQATGVMAQLEWPNDLVINGRKVGGILVESRLCDQTRAATHDNNGVDSARRQCRHVIGIGINCLQHQAHFPEPLRKRATSLELESAIAIDRTALARSLLCHLDNWLADDSWRDGQHLRCRWLATAAPLGTRIRLSHEGRQYSGHVVDLDPTASLVLQLDEGGRRHFDASRTTVIRDGADSPLSPGPG